MWFLMPAMWFLRAEVQLRARRSLEACEKAVPEHFSTFF